MSSPEKLLNVSDKADILLLHVIDGHSSHSIRRQSRFKVIFDCIDDSIIIREKDGIVIPSDNFSTTYVLREDSGYVHWDERIELRVDSKKASLKLRVKLFRDLDIVETSKKDKKNGDLNSLPVYAEGTIPFDRLLPDTLLSMLSLKHQSPQLSDCIPIEFSMDLQISKNMLLKKIYPPSGSADELLLHDEIIREAEDDYNDALQEIYQQNIINNSPNENPNNTKTTSSLRNIFILKMSFLFIPLQSLCTKLGSLEVCDKIIEMKRQFFACPLKPSSIMNSKKFILDNVGGSSGFENNIYRARTKDMWSTSHRTKYNMIGIFEELHEMCCENYFSSEASEKSNFHNDVTNLNKDHKGNKINENKKNRFLLAENEIPSRSFVQFLKTKISKFWSHRVEELIFELKMCVVSKKIANNNGGLLENVLPDQKNVRDIDSEDDRLMKNNTLGDENKNNNKTNSSFPTPHDVIESEKIINLLRSGARVRIINNRIQNKMNEKKTKNIIRHDKEEKMKENYNKDKSKIFSPSTDSIIADVDRIENNELDNGNCNNGSGGAGPIVVVRFSESTVIR